MMKKVISICGDFLGKKITGIQRVAFETMKELDKIVEKGAYELVVPNNVEYVPEYKNIKVVMIHEDNGNRHLWIQLWYAIYLVKNNRLGLTLCNEVPVIKPGIAYLHDIYYKLMPQDFVSIKDKIGRKVVLIIYQAIVKHAKEIITVTETSKKEIVDTYHVKPERITVIGNGWQHILDFKEDPNIFMRFSQIEKSNYYFVLGSLAKRKNITWIVEYARKHAEQNFVISGRVDNFFIGSDTPSNIILVGYASDEEMISLMKNCKAFLFPSIYEGFGIPPLEAMALGVKVILSNYTCLPEVYENAVYYIDPFDTNIDLDQLLGEKLKQDREEILEKYSWQKSANELLQVMKKYEG